MNIKNTLRLIESATDILKSVEELGIDMPKVLKQLQEAAQLIKSDVVTIALLGSFSDGKTSIISGLMGKVMDNMKIDTNESSDEIAIYKADFLGREFRFVDTPGLFGSRQKLVEGQKVKFSDITNEYISQANIVIYVTDVSNPLPMSHQEPLHHVMRDLRKLDNAVFVINKMDAKYDTLDEQEYKDGTAIKTENLCKRLQACLELTTEETSSLRIVCISANPKGKGLEHWFSRPDTYVERSHIDLLKEQLQAICDTVDARAINAKSAIDTAADALFTVSDAIEEAKLPVKSAISKSRPVLRDMSDSLDNAQITLNDDKQTMIQSLESLERSVKSSIDGASLETIGSVIGNELGTADGEVDFSIVLRNINHIISTCSSSAQLTVERLCDKIEEGATLTETLFKDALGKGAEQLKNVKVSPETIGKIRDTFFKNFKFKPWGKINLANNVTKWLGRIGAGLTIGLEVYDWYKQHKAAKELADAKKKLKEAVTKTFSQAHGLYDTEESFIENFVPAFKELKQKKEALEAEVNALKEKVAMMDTKQARIKAWKEACVEDVEFYEI